MYPTLTNTTVKVKPAIDFADYEKLKEDALALSERIEQVEVTEENIKATKKMLARVNASVKDLNTERIRIKNEILEPYEVFAEQIKEIESIVKTADEKVRSQVREMEEKEREEKRKELEKLWNMRLEAYDLVPTIFTFDDWIEPQHLNKSISISKVEEAMVAFLEQSETDLEVLSRMEYAERYLTVYSTNRSLWTTISLVSQQIQAEEEARKRVEDVIPKLDPTTEKQYMFIVTGTKDRLFVEILLKEHEIEFELMDY